MFHARKASTTGSEKAEKGADRDDNALGALDPMRAPAQAQRYVKPGRNRRVRHHPEHRGAPKEFPDRRRALSQLVHGVSASRNEILPEWAIAQSRMASL